MQGLLYDLLATRTRWLTQRQAVLTQNVANADTPDYRPLDLRPGSFGDLLARRVSGQRGVVLAATRADHLAGAAPRGAEARARRMAAAEVSPSGNAVVLDEQLRELARTQLEHEMAANLYRRHVGLVKTALGSGGGQG